MPILPATPENIQRAAQLLRNGGLVAFPTETVYGLGANALNSEAVAKIFATKERPSFNPLIVHVLNAEKARELVTTWPQNAQFLADAFWPGALTFVLPKRDTIPDSVTAGLPNVAVRAPSNKIARALLDAAALPIAAPSANKFTQTSPTLASHVATSLGDEIFVLDGGSCEVGIESTVLDLTQNVPILLRPGSVSRAQIEEIIGAIRWRKEIEYSISDETPRSSPGMIERHYAPRATLIAFDDERELATLIEQFSDAKIGALCLTLFDKKLVRAVQMPTSVDEYAREIYRILHDLDGENCDVIFVENVPSNYAWDGVRDRLKRASTPTK